eukprot:UN32118
MFKDMEFAECELEKDDGWKDAFNGVDYLLHTASPYHTEGDKGFDYITPAVEGTARVLKFAKEAGVTKIVVTSSMAAVNWVGWTGKELSGRTLTEKDWSRVADETNYAASKTLAEKEVWKFAKANENIAVNVANPGMINGRSLIGPSGGSFGLIKQMFEYGSYCVPLWIGMCHVEDVAELHVNILDTDVKDTRFLCAAEASFREMGVMLDKEFGKYGYTLATKDLPGCLISFITTCCCCCNIIPDSIT